MSKIYLSVKIVDDSFSSVLENRVLHATLSLTLTVSLLSISQLKSIITAKLHFFLSYCVSQDLSTGRRIGSGHERGSMYYLDDRVTPTGLVVDQPDPVLFWHWRLVILRCKSLHLSSLLRLLFLF